MKMFVAAKCVGTRGRRELRGQYAVTFLSGGGSHSVGRPLCVPDHDSIVFVLVREQQLLWLVWCDFSAWK